MYRQHEETSCQSAVAAQSHVTPMFDILLVVDTSPAMAEEQAHLEDSLRRFGQVLEQSEGGVPDIHLGVISADLGAGGHDGNGCTGEGDESLLQAAPRLDGCSPPAGSFLYNTRFPVYQCPRDQPDCYERNHQGALGDAIACMGTLGAGGCAFPQPLEAMKRALSHPDNAGFLRREAYLAVVFLTASDDCSAADSALFDPDADLGPLDAFRCTRHGVTCDGGKLDGTPRTYGACEPRTDSLLADPAAYVDFLKGLKDDPRMVVVAAAAGPGEPFTVVSPKPGQLALASSCTGDLASATPSVRLQAFLDGFPDRSTSTALCAEDLSPALLPVVQLTARTLDDQCLSRTMDGTDMDPAEPGLQPECVVMLVDDRTGAEVQRLEPCRMDEPDRPAADTPVPCSWVREQDVWQCPWHAQTEGLPPRELTRGYVVWRCLEECSAK